MILDALNTFAYNAAPATTSKVVANVGGHANNNLFFTVAYKGKQETAVVATLKGSKNSDGSAAETIVSVAVPIGTNGAVSVAIPDNPYPYYVADYSAITADAVTAALTLDPEVRQ